jgi:hypothetical protein
MGIEPLLPPRRQIVTGGLRGPDQTNATKHRFKLGGVVHSAGSQVRKNAHQTPPRIKTARTVLTANTNSIDGPGSAWRASVGVSTITPCFLVGIIGVSL